MPLINGCKYSCEPCIRGHRATSCAHTDRILVEVRKPGRPLEKCGHEFATCNCGKITELLAMASFPSPRSDQVGLSPEATLVATSLSKEPASTRERKASHHRVVKRTEKKKSGSHFVTPSTNRSSRESSTVVKEKTTTTAHQNQLSFAYQDQIYPGGVLSPSLQQSPFVPHPPAPSGPSQLRGTQTLGPYQEGQALNGPEPYQMSYSPQPQRSYSAEYSSRIEDITRSPDTQQDDNDPSQPSIRSQYIMADQESIWRARR